MKSKLPWRPIADAPKDGTWIVGYRGGEIEPVYVAMRWWNGVLPDEWDDLSCEEAGEWVGPSEPLHIEGVTHFLLFDPHPDAPLATDSFADDDAELGIRRLSRAERGITAEGIAAARAEHAKWEDNHDQRLERERGQ